MPEALWWADAGHVRSVLDDGVLWVRLARPEDANRLRWDMMMEIARLCERAGEDERVRAVVVSGEGAVFCAGDAVDDMGAFPEVFRHRRPSGAHGAPPVVEQHMLRTVRALAKPTAAVIAGAASGLGLDLACVCDFRLVADDAVLSDPRILQARHGATGITYLLPRLVGLSRASWMLLGGFEVEAEEALRIGLVHSSAPAAEFQAEADRFAAKLAALPTRSFAVKKEMTLAQLDLSFEAAMMHCLAVRQTNVIEDKDEGLAAWREGRPPRFTGR